MREAWGSRIGMPAAIWMLEIATLFLRSETELVLKSRRVIPGRLVEVSNFNFLSGKAPHNIWLGAGMRPINV